jgi:SOS-response transcriptional repressor LexA
MTETNFDPFETPPMELVIERIDERLKILGLSDREASIRATGLPDAIREIRRLKRPGGRRLIQLAAALETTPDYIGGYVDHERQKLWRSTTSSVLPITGVAELPKTVPLFGAAADNEIAFHKYNGSLPIELLSYDFDKPVDFCRAPPRIQLRDDVYAIVVFGTSMLPRFREGELLYIDPKSRPREGEDALVRVNDEFAPRPGKSWVALKTFVDHDFMEGHHLFEQYSPATQFNVPFKQYSEIHRVIPLRELLSL